jgi:hypothetical protein
MTGGGDTIFDRGRLTLAQPSDPRLYPNGKDIDVGIGVRVYGFADFASQGFGWNGTYELL